METSNTLHFLKISGTIQANKNKEFLQTVEFIFSRMSAFCLGYHLAQDVFTPNLFHFYSLWRSEGALMIFRSSDEFELLRGAFHTLGTYKHSVNGKWAHVQLFEIGRNDIQVKMDNNNLMTGT